MTSPGPSRWRALARRVGAITYPRSNRKQCGYDARVIYCFWKLFLSEFEGPRGDYFVLEQSIDAIIEALFSPESYPQQHEIFDEDRPT